MIVNIIAKPIRLVHTAVRVIHISVFIIINKLPTNRITAVIRVPIL